ncbi:uncharacterized protein LOC134722721 [Mytilus trossulus]|uniref:uncharacterized protein LOC134722721 n=1 Tax=Mytilus trossulus TaxID=6551 RepID=UPI003005ECF2
MYYIVAVFVYLGLVSAQKTQGQVEWNVTQKVSSFGQNLTIFCAVDDCCAKFSGWVRWNYDGRYYEPLVIDLRSFKSPKYAGNLRKNGFTVVLKNLTGSDMNRNYSCTYGSIVGEMKLLVTEESFTTPMVTVTESTNITVTKSTNLTVTESTNLTVTESTNLKDTESTNLTTGIIIGIVLAACVLLILLVLRFRLLKRRDDGYRPTNIDSSTETHNTITLAIKLYSTTEFGYINEQLRELLAKGPKYRIPQPINWKKNFKLLMDAVEDYARKWVKRESDEPELDTLSEWNKAIRSCIQRRIQKLRCNMSTRVSNPFKNPDGVDALSSFHDKYVVVPADKASNNIVFIC